MSSKEAFPDKDDKQEDESGDGNSKISGFSLGKSRDEDGDEED